MNKRIKEIIFKKLYKDLSHAEIIPHQDSIWFIDRENKFWYLEYKKNGTMWYRFGYFTNLFAPFSLEYKEFQLVLAEWMEEVLNYKIKSYRYSSFTPTWTIEDILKCKVTNPYNSVMESGWKVDDVLNHMVTNPRDRISVTDSMLEEVLQPKVRVATYNVGLSNATIDYILSKEFI